MHDTLAPAPTSSASLSNRGGGEMRMLGRWVDRVRTPARGAREVATWAVPGALAVVVGLVVLTTQVRLLVRTQWEAFSASTIVTPWDAAFPYFGFAAVAGLSVVAATALARWRPRLAAVLATWPFLSIFFTRTFVWAWWLAALCVAALLTFEAEAATSERARAARDLHDVVAHHVSLVAVRAESAPFVHPELDATAREVLGDIANDARDALDELRQVLTILQRAGHEDAPCLPQPGSADVASLVDDARAAGQDVELAEPVPDLPAAQGYVVYRAVQEALTNARRHVPGRQVRVEVAVRSGVVGVRVTNAFDGAGSGTPDPGRGLLGMRERAEALGGAANHAVDDGTFVLNVSLPLAPGEQARS